MQMYRQVMQGTCEKTKAISAHSNATSSNKGIFICFVYVMVCVSVCVLLFAYCLRYLFVAGVAPPAEATTPAEGLHIHSVVFKCV